MVPSLTRRQVLGTLGAAVGGSAVVGGAASQIPRDPIVTWKPAPGTWPCGRYDLGDTAANPHASPPADPEIVWQTAVHGVDYRSGVVVGPERVYASGVSLTALGRRDGTVHWQRDRPDGPLVIRDGTLFHGASPLMAFDAETGEPRWHATGPHDARDFRNFTVTAETVLATGGAYDIHDGTHKWSVEHPQFVARNGALYGYTGGDREVTKYRSRSVLDVAAGTGPTKVWKIAPDRDWDWRHTVVQDTFLLRMMRQGGKRGGPGVAAFATESGERMWTALSPSDVASAADVSIEKPDQSTVRISFSAFTRNRGFVGATLVTPLLDGDHFSAIVALSLADEAILWQRSLDLFDDGLNDIAVANGTVILAYGVSKGGEKPDTGGVLALDAATGREQWRISTEYEPVQLAVVDGTVFAVTETGSPKVPNRVTALR